MDLSIKHLPIRDRPRERLLSIGPTYLTDPELVALILGGDIATAARVLARVGGAVAMRRMAVGELTQVPGVGVARACQLMAAVELGARSAVQAVMAAEDPGIVRTPTQAHDILSDMERLDMEELHGLALDARHRLITRFCIARGSANVVHISPRDLFRRLLREGAVSTVIAHNHPSGDPIPSTEDLELTARIRAAGELVGITLLDHLIIAADGYYSCSSRRVFRDPSRRAPRLKVVDSAASRHAIDHELDRDFDREAP